LCELIRILFVLLKEWTGFGFCAEMIEIRVAWFTTGDPSAFIALMTDD
jgi:hypothetical protein